MGQKNRLAIDASRTLNKAERNYSQLEKEGLACVFGVRRFYSYLHVWIPVRFNH